MQKVYLPSSFTKCNENCGLPDFLTDYQIRHLSNPSGLPEILPKIDPCNGCKCLIGDCIDNFGGEKFFLREQLMAVSTTCHMDLATSLGTLL